MLAYGAVILSFVGAVLWGVIIAQSETTQVKPAALTLSVAPALLGWVSLLGDLSLGYAVQVAGFLGLHACERVGVGRPALPQWYLTLRARLTVVVVLTLAVAGFGVTLG